MLTRTRMATDPADMTETVAIAEGVFSAWTVDDRAISTSQNDTSTTEFHVDFDQEGVSVGVLVAVALLLSIFILAAIVGNILVIAPIITERSLRRAGNNFLISLAAADALVACLVMTFAAVNDLTNRWSFGAVWCVVWTSSDVMCCTASILNICAVSLDRYIHVRDPLRYRNLVTHRRSLVSVAVIWTMSAVISFLPISLGWHRLGKTLNETHHHHHRHHLWSSSSSSTNSNYSTIDSISDSSIRLLESSTIDSRTGDVESAGECHLDLNPWYACISSLISFYIPCVVMLFIYARLYRLSMKHRKSIMSNTAADVQKKPRSPKLPREEEEEDVDDVDDCSLAHEREQEPRPNTEPRQGQKQRNDVSGVTSNAAGGRKRIGSFNFQMVPVVTISNCSPVSRRFSDTSVGASSSAVADGAVSPCRRLGADLLPPPPQRKASTASVRLMTARPSIISVSSIRQTDHKAAITVGCIIGIFLFCWGPFFVVNIVGTVWEGSVPPVAFTFFTWLGYINSCVNPVIYGVTNVEFRRAFLRILTSRCHCCRHLRSRFDRRQDWNDNNNSYRQVRTIN